MTLRYWDLCIKIRKGGKMTKQTNSIETIGLHYLDITQFLEIGRFVEQRRRRRGDVSLLGSEEILWLALGISSQSFRPDLG